MGHSFIGSWSGNNGVSPNAAFVLAGSFPGFYATSSVMVKAEMLLPAGGSYHDLVAAARQLRLIGQRCPGSWHSEIRSGFEKITGQRSGPRDCEIV
jgi:hypothetical protein